MKSDSPLRTNSQSPVHSIWLRVAGFGLAFAAAMLVVVGMLLAVLGFGGHLLIRIRPDSSQNINYDPGNIALLSPVPVLAGMLLLIGFVVIAKRLGTSRR